MHFFSVGVGGFNFVFFPKVIANLQLLMGDSALAVQKRVIQAMTHLYRVALVWISKAKTVTEDMEAVWTVVGKIKEGSSSLELETLTYWQH